MEYFVETTQCFWTATVTAAFVGEEVNGSSLLTNVEGPAHTGTHTEAVKILLAARGVKSKFALITPICENFDRGSETGWVFKVVLS